jgi:membrane fusion protein (multidrug efflux system)
MAMAKFHLSATNIKAPFSGTIDRIPKASLIDEGELLTSLF